MTRFDECLNLVLGIELGYSEHKNDRGGATLDGVTQAVYDNWRASKALTLIHVRHMSPQERSTIYKELYWLAGKCDRLPTPLDYVHFDGCVNHGKTQANKFLQRALGVDDDGKVGNVTLGAVTEEKLAGRINIVCRDILQQRRAFYAMLVTNDPKQGVFSKGWNNRITAIGERIFT